MDTNTESGRQAESEGLQVLRGNALDQKLSTHFAIKMLSLPKRTKNLPAKLCRDTIPLILQLGKQIQSRPELPNDQEGSVLIFRQKARYLLFYTCPEQVIFPSATTLEVLFDTMV